MTDATKSTAARSALALLAGAALGCAEPGGGAASGRAAEHLPLTPGAYVVPHTVLATVRNAAGDTVEIMHGGFGSALALHPTRPGTIFLLTDRGPNVDGPPGCDKLFPVPTYSPAIGVFHREGDSLRLERRIPLRRPDGVRITGLPSARTGVGGSGEVPCGLAADGTATGALPLDPNGLDSEGLAVLPSGGFWVSDEYGPFLVEFDSIGVQQRRVLPAAVPGQLPLVLARRRNNGGMEALTATPDGEWLVGMMQSPLDNPRPPDGRPTVLRLVYWSPRTRASRQYLYSIDHGALLVSAIAPLDSARFLVIERDALPPTTRGAVKRIYRIDVREASDVSDPANSADGLRVDGETIESLSPAELERRGVRPVAKTLVVDLTEAIVGYRHDKPEGLAVLDDSTIAVVNDDDFGVTDGDGPGRTIVPKRLGGVRDRNVVYVLRTPGLRD